MRASNRMQTTLEISRIERRQTDSTFANRSSRTVDLFAGVGGLSLGFARAGYEIVSAYDNWPKALTVYQANFDHDVHELDLADVQNAIAHLERYEPDVVIGGPPCQDFSSAGKRRERANANLTKCFAEIATAAEPTVIVMENVPRARISTSYAEARSTLEDRGYGITETVLDASYCGVPQRRKRFFCVALLGREHDLLADYFATGPSLTPMSVADYFGDAIETEFYYRHPRNYSRRAIYSIHEPSATIRGVNRPIPPNYPGHHLDAANRAMARPLTTQERSRIQTFPPDWCWIGTKTNVEQMIGNAVPVELARFVAESVKLVL